MKEQSTEIVIRIGSHAEKEYIIKLAPYFDGLIVGANLFEATPGATSSLMLAVGAKDTHLYIDPMTYTFGAFSDSKTGILRTDLDWIKSDQSRKIDGKKCIIRDFKRSYKKLANALGEPVLGALTAGVAINPDSFADERTRISFCRRVADYQINRIRLEFENDEELSNYISEVPDPTAIFAPYFYIEPTHTDAWLNTNIELMKSTVSQNPKIPVHWIVCADKTHISNADFCSRIIQAIGDVKLAGIWLWFSGFFEDLADEATLLNYRDFVHSLSQNSSVYSLHGGYFSMALRHFGMRGISHGVGYGEQKNVIPVVGQGIPTVRYYLPPVKRRLGVPDIERAFDALSINTVNKFHKAVCDCAVCKGIVTNSIDDFSAFGDMRYSHENAKRKAQTPTAAKRCRFHFLLSRIHEHYVLRRAPLEEIVASLSTGADLWGKQPSLARHCTHLKRWVKVLTT